MELDEFKKKYKIHGNVDKFLKKCEKNFEEQADSIRKNVKGFSIDQLNATLFILRAKGIKDPFINSFGDLIALICMKNPSSSSDILDNRKIISEEQKEQILASAQCYRDLIDEYRQSIYDVTKAEHNLDYAKDDQDKEKINSAKEALSFQESRFEELREKVDDLFGTTFENDLRNQEIDRVDTLYFPREDFEEKVAQVEQLENFEIEKNNQEYETPFEENNEESSYEEPSVEEYTSEEPMVEEYTSNEPTVEEYTSEEPMVEEYIDTVEKPVYEEAVIEEVKPVEETKTEPADNLAETCFLFCAISLPEFKEFNAIERKKKKYANISEDEMKEKYFNDETRKTKNTKAQFDYDQKINAIAVYNNETLKDEVRTYCKYKTNTGFDIFSRRVLKENKELPTGLVEAMYYVQEKNKCNTPNRSEDYKSEAKLAFERDLAAALTPKSEGFEEVEEYTSPVETPVTEEFTTAAEPVAEDVDINLDDIQEYNGAEPIAEEYSEPQKVEEYIAPVEEPIYEEPVIEEIKEEPVTEPVKEEEYVPFMPESYAKVPDYVTFANENDKSFIDFVKMTRYETTDEAKQAFYGAYLKLKSENNKIPDKKIIKQVLKDAKASLEFDQENPFDNEKADVKGNISSRVVIEEEPEEIVEETIVDENLPKDVDETADDDIFAILNGTKKVEDLFPDMSTEDLLNAAMNGTLDLDNTSKND